MTLFNPEAPKKAVNLSINSELLQYARELNINFSATFEQALAEQLKASRREQWLMANRSAIQGYNELVDEQGVFGDGMRQF